MAVELQLVEAIAPASGTVVGRKWRARIIEGNRWGSSAYYPNEVLERDGAKVFTTGLQMYQNHPSESESYDRPERSVADLVGKLTSDAVFEEDGLYADVEFYESFAARIAELSEDVGLSVRAHGLTEEAEMDGRFGPVLVALLGADSVDVVTRAGAGGKLTSILESERDIAGRPVDEKEGTRSVSDVTKEDFEAFKTTLIEAIAAIPAALAESLGEIKAAEVAVAEVEESDSEAVVIDHAAVVEALTANHLPAASAKKIIASLNEGVSLEDAIKEQTELREAFIATGSESGTVVLNESKKATGLARSVQLLG